MRLRVFDNFHKFRLPCNDQRLREVQKEFKDTFTLGAYLISKGAKWQPHLVSLRDEKLAINCHLWYRKIAPEAQDMLLQVRLLPQLITLVLEFAIDLYVNLCFAPETKTDYLNQPELEEALKGTEWQDIFDQDARDRCYMDFLTLLLEEYYQEKLTPWSTNVYAKDS